MVYRCYFKAGGNERCDGVLCESGVFDEADEERLLTEGWRRTPHELDEVTDEALQLLRNAAKERGIKGWQRMSEETLREKLGLNDGDDKE